jgi:hypothetical protein
VTDPIPPDLQPEYEAAYDAFLASEDYKAVAPRWLAISDQVIQARLAQMKEETT